MFEKRRDFNPGIFWYSSFSIDIVWNLFHLEGIFNPYKNTSRDFVSFINSIKGQRKSVYLYVFKRPNEKCDIIEGTY